MTRRLISFNFSYRPDVIYPTLDNVLPLTRPSEFSFEFRGIIVFKVQCYHN